MMNSRPRIIAGITFFYVFCLAAALISTFPLLWSVITSIRPKSETFMFPPSIIPSKIIFTSYREIWELAPFARFFLNTLLVVAFAVAGQVGFSSMAAYAFARMHFPGRDILFLTYLGSLMIPPVVIIIPLFIMMKELHWINTYNALIAPYFFGNAFGTFLLRQFFLTLPSSLEDAAIIDGCGHFRIYSTIVVPNALSGFTALIVITFVTSWNNFLWPLIITNTESMKLLSVAIATDFQSVNNVQWTNVMAASTLSILPLIVLFLVAQRYFIESIQLSGIK